MPGTVSIAGSPASARRAPPVGARPVAIRTSMSRTSSQASARNGRTASGIPESASDSCAHTSGMTFRAPNRDEHAELAQQPTDGIEARRPLRHPRAAQPMQGDKGLVRRCLERHRSDVLVTVGLEDALHVGAVGLIAADVGPNQVRRQEDDAMAQLLDASRPELRRAARFHHHRRGRLRGQEGRNCGRCNRAYACTTPAGRKCPTRRRSLPRRRRSRYRFT